MDKKNTGLILLIFIILGIFYTCYKKNSREEFTGMLTPGQAGLIKNIEQNENKFVQKISRPFNQGWRNNIPKGKNISSLNNQDFKSMQNNQQGEVDNNESKNGNSTVRKINIPDTGLGKGFKAGSTFNYGGQSFRSGVSLPPVNREEGGVIIDGRHVFIQEITLQSSNSGSSSYILDTYGNSSITINIKGYIDPSWDQIRNSNTFNLGISLLDLTTGEILKKQEPNKKGDGVEYVEFMDTIFSEVTYNQQTWANSHCKTPSACYEVAGGDQNVQKGVNGKWDCNTGSREKISYKSEGNRYCTGYSAYQRHNTQNLENCKSKCNSDSRCNAIALGSDCVTYHNCNITDNRQKWGYNYYKKEVKTAGKNRGVGKCGVQCRSDNDCGNAGLGPTSKWKCGKGGFCEVHCGNDSDCEASGMKNHRCQSTTKPVVPIGPYKDNWWWSTALRHPRGNHDVNSCSAACKDYKYFGLGKDFYGSFFNIFNWGNSGSKCACDNSLPHGTRYGKSSCGVKGGMGCNYIYKNKEVHKKCEPKSGENTWVDSWGGANWRNLKQPRYAFNYTSKPIIIDNSVNTRVFFLVFKGGIYNPNNYDLKNLNFKSNIHGTGSMLVVKPRYEYRPESWSKCSEECGLFPGGIQERKINCYDKVTQKEPEKKGACNGLKLPPYVKMCNRKICEFAPEIKNFNVTIGKANTDNLNNNNYTTAKDYLLGINNTFNIPTEKYQPSLLFIGKSDQQINTTWRIVTKNNSLNKVYIYSPSFDGFLGIDTDNSITTKGFLKISKAKYEENDPKKKTVKDDDRDLWSISFYKKKMYPVYVIRHIKTGKYLTWYGKQMNNIMLGQGENQMGRIDLSTTPKAWNILPIEPDYNKERKYHDAIKFCLSKNRKLCTARKMDIYKRLSGTKKSSWVPNTKIDQYSHYKAMNFCNIKVWLYWIIGSFLVLLPWGTGAGAWFIARATSLEKECNVNTTSKHFIEAATTENEWFHIKDYNKYGVRFTAKNNGFYCCPEPIPKK